MIDVVISVAHCKTSPGVSVTAASLNEHEWSKRATRSCAASLRDCGISVQVIRDSSPDKGVTHDMDHEERRREGNRSLARQIRECKQINPELAAIQIHLDSSRVAEQSGPLCLYWGASEAGEKIAEVALQAVADLPHHTGHHRRCWGLPDTRFGRKGWIQDNEHDEAVVIECACVTNERDLCWAVSDQSAEVAGAAIGYALGTLLAKQKQARLVAQGA